MQAVSMYCQSIEASLKIGPDMVNITSALEQLIGESGIKTGQLCANMVGSTGSITTIEYEPGVVEDLKRAITLLAPPGMEYEHEKAWHDGNGHSHVQAALLGPSISLAVRNGRLKTGTWQQVVAINHDNHPRTRTIEVTITGHTE
jgi:secondary thiamine-phosphate synthase enzyme